MAAVTSNQPIAWGDPADPKPERWRELWANGGALAVVVVGALVTAGMYSFILDNGWLPLVVGAAFLVPVGAVLWSLYCDHRIKRSMQDG